MPKRLQGPPDTGVAHAATRYWSARSYWSAISIRPTTIACSDVRWRPPRLPWIARCGLSVRVPRLLADWVAWTLRRARQREPMTGGFPMSQCLTARARWARAAADDCRSAVLACIRCVICAHTKAFLRFQCVRLLDDACTLEMLASIHHKVPNGRRQRRAGTMRAKQDDADRRVRCTPRLGVPFGQRQAGVRIPYTAPGLFGSRCRCLTFCPQPTHKITCRREVVD